MPGWRTGIRGRLKPDCPRGRVGSTPTPGISRGRDGRSRRRAALEPVDERGLGRVELLARRVERRTTPRGRSPGTTARRPERGGHSSSNVLLRTVAASRSPARRERQHDLAALEPDVAEVVERAVRRARCPSPPRTRAARTRAGPRRRRARPSGSTTRRRPCAPRTGRPDARAAPPAPSRPARCRRIPALRAAIRAAKHVCAADRPFPALKTRRRTYARWDDAAQLRKELVGSWKRSGARSAGRRGGACSPARSRTLWGPVRAVRR